MNITQQPDGTWNIEDMNVEEFRKLKFWATGYDEAEDPQVTELREKLCRLIFSDPKLAGL